MKRLRQIAKFTTATLLAAALATFGGCGPTSDKLEVSGKVTLDGQPLDTGSIRLTSTGAGKLSASGAMITNGEFLIPQEKGLPPGKYQIEISAPDANAPLVSPPRVPGEPALPPTAPERIPVEYNSKSQHTVDVTADGENHFEFAINSRSAT
jgi:hypothetical protein